MVDGFQQFEDAYIYGYDMDKEYKNFRGQVGIKLQHEGPIHMKDVVLKNFKDGVDRNENKLGTPACGIKFHEKFRFVMGPSSTTEAINTDEIGEAQLICANMNEDATTQTSIQIRDLDGSLTGTPMASIVWKQGDVIENECEFNQEWNLSVCPPNKKFVNFYAWPKDEEPGATFITKDNDITNYNVKKLVSYKADINERYVLHMNKSLHKHNKIRVLGLDQ